MISRADRSRYLSALEIPEWTRRNRSAGAAVATGAVDPARPDDAADAALADESARPGPSPVLRAGTGTAGHAAAPGTPKVAREAAAIAAAPLPTADWERLRAEVAACTACPLHATRTQTVFGVGRPDAALMVIGEAPGADEDRQGEPFVGRAGQLLNAMLRGIGFARDDVYIANILKCRPPQNRDPRPEESATCTPFLDRQVALVAPRAILAVGRISAQWLLQSDSPIGRLRGSVHAYGQSQTPVVVTYHPAYLLRSPLAKAKSWQDLLQVRELLSGKR